MRRSRAAIVSAFNRLILDRGYASLTPGDVAETADVGRSTFYEHFASLDDVLARSLEPVLSPLANGCFEPAPHDAALRTVEHLWENRRLARALLSSGSHTVVLRSFASLFTARLADQAVHGRTRLEPQLIGLQIAAGQLAVLGAWLSGRSARSPSQIAHALHASGRATLIALVERPSGCEP